MLFMRRFQPVKVHRIILSTLLILILSLTSCNLRSSQQQQDEAISKSYTAAAQTVQAAQALITPTITDTPQPPTATATTQVQSTAAPAQPTFTPSGTFFVVDTGANCRSGPDTAYDKITSFQSGSYLTLVGHNSDNTWWYILTGNTNCWISGTTGHTTGPLTNLPLISAPPTPTSAVTGTGPLLSDPVALVAQLSYPGTCQSNNVQVAIRVADNGNGVSSVWMNYRYVGDGGYTGNWHMVSPNDNAAGGVNGFNYPIATEVASELGTQNGTFQYQFFAKDNSGNTSSYPSNSTLGMPIKYCP
jgi:uncharacterized protein YraI